MTTTIASDTDQVVHLRVSWEAYDALVSSVGDDTGSLISYDEGILEIMSPGSRHERIAKRITYLLSAVVTEWQVDLEETGSTTFRKIGERGFEGDNSYYIENAQYVRDLDAIDLAIDPPPDLVIEVDITNTRTDKKAMYASIGIKEFWHYRQDRLSAFYLRDGDYVATTMSRVISGLPISQIETMIKRTDSRLAIDNDWHQWLRQNRDLHG